MGFAIDWRSFLIGGGAFLFAFLAIMGWVVPDKPAAKAMEWLTSRKNFSLVSILLAVGGALTIVVIYSIAVAQLWKYVQIAPWVTWLIYSVVGLGLVGTIMYLIGRKKNP